MLSTEKDVLLGKSKKEIWTNKNKGLHDCDTVSRWVNRAKMRSKHIYSFLLVSTGEFVTEVNTG